MTMIMKDLIARFGHDEDGISAVEYALIAAGIGVAVIGVAAGLGTDLVAQFNAVCQALTAADCA